MLKKILLGLVVIVIALIAVIWLGTPIFAEKQLRKIIAKADTANFSMLEMDLWEGNLIVHDIYINDTSGNLAKQPVFIKLDRLAVKGFDIWKFYKTREADIDSIVLGRGNIVIATRQKDKADSLAAEPKKKQVVSMIVLRHISIDSIGFRINLNAKKAQDHISGVLNIKADSLAIPLHDSAHFYYRSIALNLHNLYAQPKGSFTYFGVNDIEFSSRSNSLKVGGLQIRQRISKEKYAEHFGFDKDYLKLDLESVVFYGLPKYIRGIKHDGLHLKKIDVSGLDAFIYKDLTLPHSKNEKKFIVEMLCDLKIPVRIDTINVKKSAVVYNENSRKDKVAGHLDLTNIDAQMLNLNNRGETENGHWTSIKGSVVFYNELKLWVEWRFDLKTKGKAFTMDINIGEAEWATLNPFMESTVGARFSKGRLKGGRLLVEADKKSGAGSLDIYYTDFKVELLDKQTQKQSFWDKAKGELASLVVGAANEKGKKPKKGIIYAEPIKDKSIFNYIAKLFFSGFLDVAVTSNNKDKVAARGMVYLPMPKKAMEEAEENVEKEAKAKKKEDKKAAKKAAREERRSKKHSHKDSL